MAVIRRPTVINGPIRALRSEVAGRAHKTGVPGAAKPPPARRLARYPFTSCPWRGPTCWG